MAIAIFGGTFDPFHYAHERIVGAVANLNYIDRLLVIPAGSPPHKQDRWISFASYRLAMAEISVKKIKKTSVSRFETIKAGNSFTVETIRYLKHKYKEDIYLIIGADSFLSFEKWYEFEEILSLAKLLVASRPGHKGLKSHKSYMAKKYRARVEFIDIEELDISSTELRSEFSNGDFEAIEINPEVKSFIVQNKIYDNKDLSKIFSSEQIDYLQEIERLMIPELSSYRAVHSINTMYQAIYIADLMGEDRWTAALAGLLHDCAKEINPSRYPQFLKNADKSFISAPSITHGPLGAYILDEKFKVNSEEIYNSIYYHSTLRKDFTKLDAIVYLADKTEPSRTYSEVEKFRKILDEDWLKALKKIVKSNIEKLEDRGKEVHPNTLEALERIKKLRKKTK